MTRLFSMSVLLASLLTLSFIPSHAPERLDLEIHLVGVDWAVETYVAGGGVVCGGGYNDTCPVVMSASLVPGDYPAGYSVRVTRNGEYVGGCDFSSDGYYGTYCVETYNAQPGDEFVVSASAIVAVCKSEGCNDEDSDEAELYVSMGI